MVPQYIVTFADRFPLVGPLFWAVSVQYFVTMLVVALDWPTGYSALQNTISDLGNTSCGTYGGRYVCSPLHVWMNASFIVLGVTMVAGAVLIYQEFRKSRGSAWGFGAMAAAGVGTILVGIFAENTNSSLHEFGSMLPFVIGNVGLVVLGKTLDIPRRFRQYTIASGVVSLAALVLFVSGMYLGLGRGGMERVVAFPQTIWLIVFGLYMSRSHVRRLVRAWNKMWK